MTAKVRIGMGTAGFPFSAPRRFFEWAQMCEQVGVDSLWQSDRLHSRQPFLESMSTMASLCAITEKMRFGMNAVVVSLRDPLLLAKQCATIDFLSGGRLLPVFGVGGPSAPEWKATGRSPKDRGRRADEALEIIRRLWQEEKVSFAGDFYHYHEASICPRPVQKVLPLWIGGHSPAAVRRTARIGTGWLGGIQTHDQVAPVIRDIKTELARVGRRIDEDHYGAIFAFRFGSLDDPELSKSPFSSSAAARSSTAEGGARSDYLAVGDAATILARIEAYRRAGASKFVLIPVADGDEDFMEQTRRLAAEVLPVAHAEGYLSDVDEPERVLAS